MITEERKEELNNLVGSYYVGAGPGAMWFGRDNQITAEEWDFIHTELNVADCEGCGWPEYSEDLESFRWDDGTGFCWRCAEDERERQEEED